MVLGDYQGPTPVEDAMSAPFIVGEETNRFTFPAHDARLDKDAVEAFGLGEGLKKFGEQLLSQYPEASGVKFVGVEFVFCLKVKEKPRRAGCAQED